MEFGVLGPLAVWAHGRELPLGRPKQRAVLASLILRSNEFVPTATLVEDLWGEQPPATAVKAVQGYISGLRKVLGETVIETRSSGYVLRVEPDALDLPRFERLREQGQELLARGATEDAGRVLREALALWRGPPLADFQYEAFARNEIRRLEELRLATLELRLEVDLALGRVAEAVGELEALVESQPRRENLRELLMLALYRAGRQADALAVYRDTRAILVDDLGLEPSQSLRRLEQAILRRDPSLELPAATLAAPPPEVEMRKTVTVVFCDLDMDTALGERPDPESLRRLSSRSFELVSAAVERYGGTVERFVGDEVMAVFGVPITHEDDALRALRAAVELRDALPRLVGVHARIGIDTGEVLTGGPASGHGNLTGRAVAVARRLGAAADPDEVLVGEATFAFVRGAAEVESLDPNGGTAFRVVRVREPPARLHGMRFVGRERELALVEDVWQRLRDERRCELVTVVGEAGIGKSRLAAEFLASIDAPVVRGRCLPYGEAITYWPVVEVLNQLALPPPDGTAAATIRSLVADTTCTASADEIGWAFRKALEHAAAQRPLVVVLDDIHWAEETLLDLVEQVALLSTGAAILLFCMARPELVARRASWPVTLRLEPLSEEQVDELLREQVAGRLRARIARAAGGNPLFIQEMLALAREGVSDVVVPPTLQALLAARLDQLAPGERSVLERGAVEGELFHRGAVQALSPDPARATSCLASLVRRGLIRPERTDLPGEDAFRFRHLLIRDAAYEALPKTSRADLHERYAAWLEEHGGLPVSLDELLGHHLEQSYRYRTELGLPADETRALGDRAAGRLASAGHRALVRGDVTAAVNLLERSLALGAGESGERTRVKVDLAFALGETGRMAESDAILEASIDAATGLEERGLAMRALVQRSGQRLVGDPSLDQAEIVPVAEAAVETFAQLGDPSGLALAERLLAMTLAMIGRTSESTAALERALVHAEASGDQATRRRVVATLSFFLAGGPHGGWPVGDAIRRCHEALESSRDDPVLEAVLTRSLSLLMAMAGRFEEARDLVDRSSLVLDELNQLTISTVFQRTAAQTKELIGDRAGAEQERVERFTRLRDAAAGALDTLTMAAARELANFYCDEGRWDEAADVASYGRDGYDPSRHPGAGVAHLVVEARLAAHRGELPEALTLARHAVALVEPMGNLDLRARVHVALAEVQRSSGRTAEADAAIATAIELYEQRGNVTAARRLRATRAGDVAPAGAVVEATTR